ncbi:MAG: NADH:ubiquinone oxidoreductase subunit N, partial [Methylophilus sp.]
MENIQFDMISILPEITVLCMAMLILIIDLFIKPKNRFIVYGLSQFTLFAAAWFTFQTHTPT